jgi:hypothetical protein
VRNVERGIGEKIEERKGKYEFKRLLNPRASHLTTRFSRLYIRKGKKLAMQTLVSSDHRLHKARCSFLMVPRNSDGDKGKVDVE